MLSRLTPVPFGIQNAVFALSPIKLAQYLPATCLGLFPGQLINTYLGSRLRSMEEVFGDANTASLGFLILVCQLCIVLIILAFIMPKFKTFLNINVQEDPEVVVIDKQELKI